jgi:hypothetical protein
VSADPPASRWLNPDNSQTYTQSGTEGRFIAVAIVVGISAAVKAKRAMEAVETGDNMGAGEVV